MFERNDDVPRLPAEDVVERSTAIPDVAHDDERHQPRGDEITTNAAEGENATAGDDLDRQMTD